MQNFDSVEFINSKFKAKFGRPKAEMVFVFADNNEQVASSLATFRHSIGEFKLHLVDATFDPTCNECCYVDLFGSNGVSKQYAQIDAVFKTNEDAYRTIIRELAKKKVDLEANARHFLKLADMLHVKMREFGALI